MQAEENVFGGHAFSDGILDVSEPGSLESSARGLDGAKSCERGRRGGGGGGG